MIDNNPTSLQPHLKLIIFQVYSCKQRDILYSLHESGIISAKVKRKTGIACSPIDAPAPSIASLGKAFTDVARRTEYVIRSSNCRNEFGDAA